MIKRDTRVVPKVNHVLTDQLLDLGRALLPCSTKVQVCASNVLRDDGMA